MTDTTKQAEILKTWPEKVYAHTRHWGKDDEAGRFMGCRNVDVEFPRPDNYVTVEYIRADLVKKSHMAHQIAEAARCLGVAQVKNDSEAIKYWTSKVDELTNSDWLSQYREYISADTVRKLQLEAIRKALETAILHGGGEIGGAEVLQNIARIDPEEILKGLTP